ncbi:hypothetical protein WAF17_11940 [Bernardetia sp. ABR2-2B]|uniref:hypothetical protein n=1 Tax=Bernardetia sp. ABR2-2B TaxID=3127472 RepID=UPI0030CC639C
MWIIFFTTKKITFLAKNTHQTLLILLSFICSLQTLGLVFAVIRLNSKLISTLLTSYSETIHSSDDN